MISFLFLNAPMLLQYTYGYAFSFLKDHADFLLAGKPNAKIFIPLCGKTVDMKWYVDLIMNVPNILTTVYFLLGLGSRCKDLTISM